ncbi:DUF4282 domain-containing protein [Actinomadura xylanilytica]|uniref:DUF4282 domain-containing protein n=1 Tax=Actinomadura xylanilytica TaxID=887459 RepID=UPI00255B22ED|nr:DUF4282 domain-containing protein [Actinomadura xylanilytica]MDL4777859.1 DUF4282 domain-containing protein [Actinomadura xylanilytica]
MLPPQPPPAPPPPPARPPGLLMAVLDTRFTTLVTPMVITWIYRGCLAGITVITLWWLLMAWWVLSWRNGWLWGVMMLLAAPVIGFVALLVVRVACEAVLIRYRPPPIYAVDRPPPARLGDPPDGSGGSWHG